MNRDNLSFLLADDDTTVRVLISDFLKARYTGCRIDETDNGEIFLEKSRAAREKNELYNLYITDNRMPGMNGIDALIRARKEGDRTPAILISGTTIEDIKSYNCLPSIMSILTKPFDTKKFYSEVDRILFGS